MTKNFSIKEFNCKCGCEMPSDVLVNITKLANQLQYVRDNVAMPIKINSAYRCEAHNKSVGGSKTSQHLLGKAADITIQSLKPAEVYALIEELIDMGHMLQGGLGLYEEKGFVHYDIRKTKARWNG